MLDNLYNIAKAARKLGVSRSTLYRWEKEGKIHFVVVHGFNKVSETEIEKLRGKSK